MLLNFKVDIWNITTSQSFLPTACWFLRHSRWFWNDDRLQILLLFSICCLTWRGANTASCIMCITLNSRIWVTYNYAFVIPIIVIIHYYIISIFPVILAVINFCLWESSSPGLTFKANIKAFSWWHSFSWFVAHSCSSWPPGGIWFFTNLYLMMAPDWA